MTPRTRGRRTFRATVQTSFVGPKDRLRWAAIVEVIALGASAAADRRIELEPRRRTAARRFMRSRPASATS